jgi:hypothetical protein
MEFSRKNIGMGALGLQEINVHAGVPPVSISTICFAVVTSTNQD